MIRPTIVEGVKVQHIAGQGLTLEMISDPSFIPPPFDVSYHFKGMRKPRGQEKYNPDDYIILHEPPTAPVRQITQPLFTDGFPARYSETKPPVPTKSEVRVDEHGVNASYSYNVELPQEVRHQRVPNQNVYVERHGSPITHPVQGSHIPFNERFTRLTTLTPHSFDTRPTGNNSYSQQFQDNYVMSLNHLHPPLRSFTESPFQPDYRIPIADVQLRALVDAFSLVWCAP